MSDSTNGKYWKTMFPKRRHAAGHPVNFYQDLVEIFVTAIIDCTSFAQVGLGFRLFGNPWSLRSSGHRASMESGGFMGVSTVSDDRGQARTLRLAGAL
ncbi:hypothetical protein AAE026_13245 [Bradyrhizobium sp. DN5]|uniref:hypothetical protein n=1 Tax=Bradyrhizobium sp. DN5 TaxID=3056950 RepID=UPI0035268EA7